MTIWVFSACLNFSLIKTRLFKFVGRKLHFLQIYVGRLRVGLKKGVELLRPATVEVMRSAGAGARDAGRCQSPDLPFRYRCCNRFLPDRFGAPKPTVILSDFRRSNHPFRNLEILCDFQNSEVHEIPQRSKNHAKLKKRFDFGTAWFRYGLRWSLRHGPRRRRWTPPLGEQIRRCSRAAPRTRLSNR